uniref:CSON013653 protein n=1 Tax=Culicoides sonorensis TaxID=179676 RepID=A0A336K0N7_CULSO
MSVPNIRNMFSPKLVASSWSSKYTKKFQIHLPEKLKGGLIEKWANYWKQLGIDYKDMLIDTGKHMIKHPVKTVVYATTGYSTYILYKNNPDFEDFKKDFQNNKNQLILVHHSCQNPVSAKHIKDLEQWFNQGVVKRLTFGIVSFIWIDNFDKDVSLYKATCNYLKPPYSTFNERVIDIGFWNKFWILEDRMKDYDVNF